MVSVALFGVLSGGFGANSVASCVASCVTVFGFIVSVIEFNCF